MTDDDVSAAYWAGAQRDELVVQRCDSCGQLRHYPRALCDACYSFDWTPVEIDKQGTVYSWTVSEHAFEPALADEVPYVLATVDMAPGIRVLGRLSDASNIHPGMAVRLHFDSDESGRPFPVFVPSTT